MATIESGLRADIFGSDLSAWRRFASQLIGADERQWFEEILNDYCDYVDVLTNAYSNTSTLLGYATANDSSRTGYFPSEPLIIALILSQQKKIINWLMAKIPESNTNIIHSNTKNTDVRKDMIT
jgi:hypothetical protein